MFAYIVKCLQEKYYDVLNKFLKILCFYYLQLTEFFVDIIILITHTRSITSFLNSFLQTHFSGYKKFDCKVQK